MLLATCCLLALPVVAAVSVIGSGHGRTGTSSLRVALAKLYDVPLEKIYHMESIVAEGNYHHIEMWTAMKDAQVRGDRAKVKEVARELLDGYVAAIDYPPSLFYEELLELYPDAKCVHSVREFKSWFKSVRETLWTLRRTLDGTWMLAVAPYLKPSFARFWAMVDYLVWDPPHGLFNGTFIDENASSALYNEWNAKVHQKLPKERVLTFSAKDGWAPLCEFLGRPVPEGTYPHVNDASKFARMIRLMQIADLMGKAAVPLGLFALAFGVRSRLRGKDKKL
mmetsp:Transcript_37107/g.115470  ORF Transcript_37107/g.115470 Transcript_37107/m.115470 type:complete len:280 (-) Transcript_37107:62-901(-)